jgi:hypothetical protein
MDTVFVQPSRVLVAGILGGLAVLAWRIAVGSEGQVVDARTAPGPAARPVAADPARPSELTSLAFPPSDTAAGPVRPLPSMTLASPQ